MSKRFILIGIMAVAALAFIIISCGDNAKETPTMPTISTSLSIQAVGPEVVPVLVDPWKSGNAVEECAQAGACAGGYSYKIDSWGAGGMDGTHGAITISNSDSKTFDWEIAEGYAVCAVIVKAGTGAYVYYYDDATSDDGLVAPWGKDISHATFCARYKLFISKTAETEYTRDYDWTIDKVADGNTTELTLSVGQTYTLGYDVTVTAAPEDKDFKVTGTITIENKSPLDAVITDITDKADGVTATFDNFTMPSVGYYTLSAGDKLEIDYTANLTAKANGTNTVTVETSSPLVAGGTAFANYTFGDPTTLTDNCVDVTDDQYGDLGTFCVNGGLSNTFDYNVTFGPYTECDQTIIYKNIASFLTNTNSETGSDDWTVTITVPPCDQGCTLTQGYWKTHSEYGPAPYDDTWALLTNGADTPFFSSGQTYYQVLWTPPAGNVYYNLAHQYIAAELNGLNGADQTAVQVELAAAKTLLETYTPAQAATLKGKAKTEWTNLASTLDSYNNGDIGPGHCDEQQLELEIAYLIFLWAMGFKSHRLFICYLITAPFVIAQSPFLVLILAILTP